MFRTKTGLNAQCRRLIRKIWKRIGKFGKVNASKKLLFSLFWFDFIGLAERLEPTSREKQRARMRGGGGRERLRKERERERKREGG